jgi:Zn-dependent M28 family amino/carboxypeptidase
MNTRRILLRIASLALPLFLAIPLVAQQADESAISTLQQVQESFSSVPCKSTERLPAVRELFEKMGAPADAIKIEKFRDAENLVVTKKGTEPGRIVIGGHYDFVDDGCGAIDNWTGIVAMAHLYRSLQQLAIRKTVLFVAFGNEETGLKGSRAMVRAIPRTERASYCAMINIDSFGMAAPFALKNISSKKLLSLVEERAAVLKVPFSSVTMNSASSDSESVLDAKIPAVTLSGLSKDWESILHTKKDQVSGVNFASVYLGYRLALSTWASVDEAPCGAYNDQAK